MRKPVRCPNCHHVFPVSRSNVLSGKLNDRLPERLREIEHELGGLRFHEGILSEQERALKRERHEIEKQLSGTSTCHTRKF